MISLSFAEPISWSCGSERAPAFAPANIASAMAFRVLVAVALWRDLLTDILKCRRHVGDRALIQTENTILTIHDVHHH